MSDLEEKIRHRAFALWQAAGEPEGRSSEFWFLAMRELHNEADPAAHQGDKPGASGSDADTSDIPRSADQRAEYRS